MRVLVIDNYDSFTWNLVQYLGELGAEPNVVRNDVATVDELLEGGAERVVVSPGPCTPAEAGISVAVVKRWGSTIPTLGVCLGHQAIGEAYGGEIIRAKTLMHGKTSEIHHSSEGVFAGLDDPFTATRYHSLVIKPETLPGCLEVTARTADHVIMGVRHREFPMEGVQFHPESIMTPSGMRLLSNFLSGAPAAA